VAKVGDLVKVTGSIQSLFDGQPIGIIQEIYTGASYHKEYKVQWTNPDRILNADKKTMQYSWLKLNDFEIISED